MNKPAGGTLPGGKGATKARFPGPAANGEPEALNSIVMRQVTEMVKVLTVELPPAAVSTQT